MTILYVKEITKLYSEAEIDTRDISVTTCVDTRTALVLFSD